MGCLFLIPGAATFPCWWGHLCLLWTPREQLKWLRSTKIKPKPALEPSRRDWSLHGTGTSRLDSSCFLCSWSFSLPSPAETAQLPPKHSISNLKCFVKTLSSFGGKGRWCTGQKHSVSSISKQYFLFPVAVCSVVFNIFTLLYNTNQNYS